MTAPAVVMCVCCAIVNRSISRSPSAPRVQAEKDVSGAEELLSTPALFVEHAEHERSVV